MRGACLIRRRRAKTAPDSADARRAPGCWDEWPGAARTARLVCPHVLASYEVRNIHHDYCPPIHLQQLKKALVSREEFERVAEILKTISGAFVFFDRSNRGAVQETATLSSRRGAPPWFCDLPRI